MHNAHGKTNVKNTCRTLHPKKENNVKRHESTRGPNRTDRRCREQHKSRLDKLPCRMLISIFVAMSVDAAAHYHTLTRCVSFTIDCAENEMGNCSTRRTRHQIRIGYAFLSLRHSLSLRFLSFGVRCRRLYWSCPYSLLVQPANLPDWRSKQRISTV